MSTASTGVAAEGAEEEGVPGDACYSEEERAVVSSAIGF